MVNYIFPENFEKNIKEYLNTLPSKVGEYNKRAYMKSKLMEGILQIKPEFIGFEEKRNDIFYAGILIETKNELNKKMVDDAKEELKRYKEEREIDGYNITKLIITDGNTFEVYNGIRNMEYKLILNEEIKNSDEYTLGNLYTRIYLLFNPENVKLVPKTEIIVPRLLELENELLKLINNKVIKIGNREYSIKYDEWKNYVAKVLGNENEITEDFFLRHVIIYYYSLFIVGKSLKIENNEAILDGSAFMARGILNFIEPDNFFDIFNKGNKFFDYIEKEIDLYDFTDVKDDIFRVLYESVISPNERHNLGEFYTPEWLAKILVNKLVTKDNVVLDPTCGSGTFLKLAIERKMDLGSNNIIDQVIGFDINPIAVIFSKANYILSLRGKWLNFSFVIPVFLADSLMTYYRKSSLYSDVKSVTVDFSPIKDIKAEFDYSFVGKTDYPIANISKYINDMRELVESNLNNENIDFPSRFKGNEDLIKKLVDLVKSGKDGVWFYILKNIYTPYYFRNKIDVVLGNPPWLTYKEISFERQKDIDAIYNDYKMGHGSQNKANMDYAGFFIARSLEYLKKSKKSTLGKIGFVLTRSVINAAQYNGLRRKLWENSPNIEEVVDINNSINPFRKPSCILIFTYDKTTKIIKGALIKSDNKKPDVFSPDLKYELLDMDYYINISKNESSISNKKFNFSGISYYKDIFRRGATIFPRPYYFIKIENEEKYAYIISTDDKYNPETADKRHKKGNYQFSWDHFYVLKDLIYNVIMGESIKNFKVNLNEKAILPLTNNKVVIDTYKDTTPYTYSIRKDILKDDVDNIKKSLLNVYVNKLNEIEIDWEKNRGAKFNKNNKKKANSYSVMEWLNYGNKLLSQHTYKHLVVYNQSGTSIRCAVLEEKNIIVDHTAYYAYFENKSEAYYVCGVLNSKYLLEKLKNSGILSERHIHKKPFEMNIQPYDKNNEIHNKIVEISSNLSKIKNDDDFKNKYTELENYVKKII